MTTFHLYIVFRLWFWLSLAFGTVTWRGFWQLPAERNKPSTLSTFKWSLSHRWEAWCMLMKLGCVCTGLRRMGCGVGGWVAAGKTFLIYPLVPKWQKPCQEQGGTSKMTPLTKFAPPHPLSWHSDSSPRSDLNSKTLCCKREKRNLHKKKKKGGKKGRRRLEVATDLSEVVRSMGWIGSCWCNVPQQKQHTGKRLSLQNLSSTPLHFYVCIKNWKQAQGWFIFYFTKLQFCRRIHL